MKFERAINNFILSSVTCATKWELVPWLVGIESLRDSGEAEQRSRTHSASGDGGNVNQARSENDLKEKNYATILDMLNGELHDFLNSKGVTRIRSELSDLAERTSLHLQFLSPSYLSRLLFALLFVFVGLYVNAVASVIAGYRTPHTQILSLDGAVTHQVTLPDLGHDLWAAVLNWLDHQRDYIDFHSLPDKMLEHLGKATLLFMLLHPKRLMIIRRVAVILGILCFCRATTVSVTTLPDASPTCHAQFFNETGFYKSQPIFPKAFIRGWIFLMAPDEHITCGDMIFSGHTTLLVLCTLIFRKYFRAKKIRTKIIFRSFHIPHVFCTLFNWIVSMYSMVAIALIVGTRFHYTLDVLIAMFLTYFIFSNYHTWAKHDKLRKKNLLLHWLEADSVRRIDDEAYKLATRE
mmetsp:Transcript_34586/g.44133  ORF Transcript_34586/g.44133 Transcript_34586/m.44133 type:complete len:407 (+) Transcript_34586:155-1375(+)